MADILFDPGFLARLEQLQLASRRIFAGRMRGERRSSRKGQSVEFADYRDYAAGDDLRFIDWNIYARLDRLFIKLFLEEQDVQFNLLLDTSASMNFGEPSKLDYGKKVVAALAYIGLAGQDRVVVAGIGASLRDCMAEARGKAAIWRAFRLLEALTAEGDTNLGDACRAFALRHRRRGVTVVVSDFFDPHGYEETFRPFLNRRDDVYAIHVLAAEDAHPVFNGHLKLIDAETGGSVEITATPRVLELYQQTVTAYCGALKTYCTSHGIQYLCTTTRVDFERIILQYLRQCGLIR